MLRDNVVRMLVIEWTKKLEATESFDVTVPITRDELEELRGTFKIHHRMGKKYTVSKREVNNA